MLNKTKQKALAEKQIFKKRNLLYKIFSNLELLLLASPAVIFFIIFCYLPMFGIIIAFKDYKNSDGILGSDWVGLQNFKFFFSSQDALRTTSNTLFYGITFIITGMIAALIVALLLFEVKNKLAIKYYQSTMILPNFMSWVVVGYISYIILNPEFGVLTRALNYMGFDEINFYSDPKYWPYILTFSNLWKKIGIDCILYYAALMGINEDIFEAADLDGATKAQKAWYISLPSISSIAIIVGILAIGNILRGDFGLFYQIPRDVGALYPTTDVIDTYIYRGLRTGDMGITAAVGLFQSAVGIILVLATNAIVKKFDAEQALF